MKEIPQNSFLLGLTAQTFSELSPHLSSVELELGSFLVHDEGKVEWVYFPTSSLLSMISAGSGGQTVETSMVGNEGAAGLLEACGSQISSVDCVVQVDGLAWRAPAGLCRKLAASNSEFGLRIIKLGELQLTESRQSGFCQAKHNVESRFARWMCESADRCGGRNPLPMTQSFLAAMLGVQRTTVSGFASALQRRSMIRYRRGAVQITNRAELELMCCECRDITASHRRRMGFEPILAAPLAA